MFRKLGSLVIAFGLVLPVWAVENPGSISGYVRNANGVPQMGAVVEVLGSAVSTMKVFTNENGFYSASGLLPGIYSVKVSAPSFLPALRDRVGLRAGASLVVNLTLNTIFDAVQFVPVRGKDDEDDWKWVLRSASNRPILRLLDEHSPQQAQLEKLAKGDSDLKGTLSFLAGSPSDGFGGTSDMSTDFSLEKSIFSSGTVALHGDVGYGEGLPDAVLRASYSHKLANGSAPEVALTVRHLASPDINLPNSDLEALALNTSDDLIVGDILELKFGSELQTIQFMGRQSAFRPFGSVALHLSPDTVVAYGYATSQPDSRTEKGFDSAPADLSESGPHMSISNFTPAVEKAQHHEISVSEHMGKNSLQIAGYFDRVTNPALTGVGEIPGGNGNVLPDIYSGTFTYQGRELDTRGMRIVLQRKLTSDITATVDYGYGGVLDLGKADVSLQDAREWTQVQNRHSLTGKVNGTLPRSKTSWIASYGWLSGQALTPVDMFNASAGQADPYLDIFFRQPIPGTGFFPNHVDVLIDVRNLLAQGYVPVMGQDGRTVYLVQSARAVRGGVAFTF
ncbi:MAG: carboxypeptidase-like regulatory domain-containing protein [Terriglobales bacterium]